MSKIDHSFLTKVAYIGMKYYEGNPVKWLITDRRGNNVYCGCNGCGNLANGVDSGTVLGLDYNIPICKKHMEDV